MGKILNLIFGICSLLGLLVTLVTLNKTLQQIELLSNQNIVYENLATIYKILDISIVSLIGIFIFQSILFNINIRKLNNDLKTLPQENEYLRDVINHYLLIFRKSTDSIHNITHYYRYITILLRDTVISLRKKDSTTTEDDCNKICHEFEKYISGLLNAITSTISIVTKDECSSCIKIMNNNKVKTFYRDPSSYRTRKDSDYTQQGDLFVYHTDDNYAFNKIADPNSKDTFFACDNLDEHSDYYNRNYDWNKLYNATIVIPIQANLSGHKHKKEMHILGFLCCDNMLGGFEDREIKDFLSSIGDLLYNIFVLYDRFYLLAKDKGISDEALQNYGDWGSNR